MWSNWVSKSFTVEEEFTSVTFTNAGATGRLGPTQAQINEAYKNTLLEGKVTSQDGIQLWTVPHTGTYKIETWGAQGGANYHTQRVRGGYGAYMSGEFELTKGETLRILVGQRGLDGTTDDFASCPTNQKQGAGGFGGEGAGGYTGGGAGGGGSYNAGANQSNASVVNSGHGKVVISLIER